MLMNHYPVNQYIHIHLHHSVHSEMNTYIFLMATHPIFSVTRNCDARNDIRVTVDSHFSPNLNNIQLDQICERQQT